MTIKQVKFELLDKRSRTNRWYKKNRQVILALLVLAALILTSSISWAIQKAPLQNPQVKPATYGPGISKEEYDRIAIEYFKISTPTPVPARTIVRVVRAEEPTFTFTKHSSKPHYQEIIQKLEKLYPDWQAAAEIVGRESGFDPSIKNPTSFACGLPQALPCSKMKCDLSDIDCQLNWQKGYIISRYGSATAALKFHDFKGWY